MHRAIRFIAGLAVIGLVLTFIILTGFRAWAFFRETTEPGPGSGAPGQFVTANGLAYHFMQWGDGSGTPFLMIPGTLAWSGTWVDVAEGLAAKGHRVIAVDLPPFGFSQRPANGDYSRRAQAKRILEFAKAAGLSRFILVGHSFGGGATMETALTRPGNICGLALLDVAMRLDNPAPEIPVAQAFAIAPLRTALMSATFTNPLMLGKGLRDFIENDALVDQDRIAIYRKPLDLRSTSKATGDWFLSGLFGDERSSRSADRRNYGSFEKRTLIIWGKNDTVTPLVQGKELDGMFANSQLHILGGVNHIPQVENPQSVAGLLNILARRPEVIACR